MTNTTRMDRIPGYAVDLLNAAKLVAMPPVNATPQMLDDHLRKLGEAVAAFEASMPKRDGVIQEGVDELIPVGWFTRWQNGTQSLRLFHEVTSNKVDYAIENGGKIEPVFVLPWQADELGLKWRPEDRAEEAQA